MADVVELEGGPELTRALKGIENGLDDLEKGATAASVTIRAEAARRAPTRTGRLRGSLTARAEKGVAYVGAPVSYGIPVHQGVPARNIGANPFLRDAVEATRETWLHQYEENIQQLIDTEVASKAKTH